MQGWWSGLPEWLRWVLFLPLLFGALLVAQLILPFLLGGAVPVRENLTNTDRQDNRRTLRVASGIGSPLAK